jgi:thiamine-phosphate pyrophosphorylase
MTISDSATEVDMDPVVDPFYPIVPDLDWLERLLPLGVRMIQLRLQRATPAEIDRQVARGLMLCRRDGSKFVVNGHWEAVIRHGADFLHLDPDEFSEADITAIRNAGIRLGLSASNQSQLMSALEADPDYLAYGPVHETPAQGTSWDPQNIEMITIWAKSAPCPLVAIGGVTFDDAEALHQAGALSLAVDADFLDHAEPDARVRQWCAWADRIRELAA